MPELQQLDVFHRRSAWSPYQCRCSTEEDHGPEVQPALTRPRVALARQRTSAWQGSGEGDVYSVEREWRGCGDWASGSPDGVQYNGASVDGVRSVLPMNLQGTYDDRMSQLPRASTAALRSVTGAPVVGTHAQPVNHRKKRTRTGTWIDFQLAAVVVAVDGGSKIAVAARDAGILQSSLRDYLYGRTLKRKKGRQGVLNEEEESTLVK